MLGRLKDKVERIGRRILERGLVRVMPRNPNALTISSLIMALPTPYLMWLHHYWAYVLTFTLLIIASAFDMLDGLIARYWGRASRLGAFLDSTLDRYVDFIALIDLWIVSDMNLLGIASLLLAILGSLMTSYTRARAEALGVRMIGVGLLEREERLILILLILLIFIVTGIDAVALYGLLLLALLTNATAIERIITVVRSLGSS
ncbi:archaetidylinositol phosphate synthase [Vulcanisaeta sp. JCM 16161]